MSFLLINDVAKDYGNFRALYPSSFSIKQGEFVCLLGPSGCGKTTLLNIIAGLHYPDQGSLICGRENITNISPEKRKFGVVFQNYALFPNLNVKKNISYGLNKKYWSKKQMLIRVDELLDMVGLPHVGDRFPGELSGGQQQRIALARAIANKPRLLLLDEPLSALDAKVRNTLRNELKRLQRKLNITVIMVTHDQDEAMSLSDRIVLMNGGHIEQIGTPEELYLKPKNRFCAEFIGNMNILRIPQINNGKTIAIRYEQVIVRAATEKTIIEPHTIVAKLEDWQLLGSYYRLELTLSDQVTKLFADIPFFQFKRENISDSLLVAIKLQPGSWCTFDE